MKPNIDPSVFVAPSAVVEGRITIGPRSSVWHHAVLRGDTDSLVIGTETNVQDHVIMHTDAGIVCSIGNRVTVGHAAIIHGATIEDECLIGIRATILNGCRIGRGSIVAAGAVLPEGTVVPPLSVVMGIPGKIARGALARDAERIERGWRHYVQLSRERIARP